MNHPLDRTLFLTWVYSAKTIENARTLIDSIRSFGGPMSECPIWLFETNPEKAPCKSLESDGVQVFPLSAPESVRHHDFGSKVYMCARAEEMATSQVRSLVCIDPVCVIIKPPLLFDLSQSFDAAVRPVHIQNVGILAAEPLNGYWKEIYETVGVDDVQTTVESFVDAQHLRAYFNSHALAVNPAMGLFRRWFEHFEALVGDQAFQSGPCQDEWHKLFLFQAVFSALLATALDPGRLYILPPEYNYPYNLHQSLPPERRARALNELVSVVYEDRSLDPKVVDDIEIHEPLRAWLAAHAGATG